MAGEQLSLPTWSSTQSASSPSIIHPLLTLSSTLFGLFYMDVMDLSLFLGGGITAQKPQPKDSRFWRRDFPKVTKFPRKCVLRTIFVNLVLLRNCFFVDFSTNRTRGHVKHIKSRMNELLWATEWTVHLIWVTALWSPCVPLGVWQLVGLNCKVVSQIRL